MKQVLIVLSVFFTLATSAQTGTIRGTVFDGTTGESLVGVTVVVQGTTTGTSTDLDGKFSLKVPVGTYSLQISFISYQPLVIDGVVVKENDVVVLENLKLNESSVELQAVVVTAQAVRTTETALQTLKMRSAVMFDGISSAKFKLIGDATAVEAAKRVTGVTIEGGKYVYVRGLGDRYSKTTLNNLDIPGLDPDKNSLQMDIFPTNLIDNIIVSKNFTADMPADFTGGILNIETKDFPESKITSVSFSTSFNPQVHFNPNYLTYGGGNTDFLGFDDGTRALPDKARWSNIPTPISGASEQEVVDFVRSFNPELAAKRQTSLMDLSASFTIGDQIDLKNDNSDLNDSRKLGYIFSLSHKSDYKFYDEVVNSEYQRYTDPSIYDLRYAFKQNGEIGERNVLVGLLGGIAYKTSYSKLRLMLMHLQNGESRAGKFSLNENGEAIGQSGYIGASDNLEYNQRSLTNMLLNGNHIFNEKGWEIDWRISPTFSTSSDPDIRKTAFTYRSVDTLFLAGAAGNPSRIWRSLYELNAPARIDFEKKYTLLNNDAKLKFGASHTFKYRSYEILFFDIQFFGTQSWPNPDPATVLDLINLYPNRPNAIYYQSGNSNPNPNAYRSNVNNTAFYISNEFSLHKSVKLILGLRAENYVQRHTGRDQRYAMGDTQNGQNLDNEKVLNSLDLFPSVNSIFSITENQNVRASYSRTIARPSFKELSFAQILDPISDRIFNGSLFTYSSWDGKLTETRIDNIDLRWELFMERGEVVSLSGFFKKFDNPIELVRIPEQQTSTEYQPRNVGDGQLYGVEFELRKDLDFIPALSNFNISGNVTYVESKINMTDVEYNARLNFERTGEVIEKTREMAGQSPYVINAGISYSSNSNGIDAGLFYNVKGSTLTIVGGGLYPDIYIEPFHSLNFSFNKKLGKEKNTTIDFKVSNILNSKTQSVFKSYNTISELYNSMNPGISFSMGVSYKFN
ncbi:MAG TPA: TonB-dependent receptor [Tenuifilaceae bacterium]|nr:TonB-dependent receptor [Tenuifilaceae bacterium]HRX68856.1 TonB-dependent receptor [Tenuifilaceae bacterium]